jgi:hypothetical protein
MRLTAITVGICTSLVWALALANVDLSDFDDDVMRTMGETMKSLEADIGANNTQAAISDVSISRQGMQYAESYFAAKGDTPDAVKFARDSRILADNVLQALLHHDTRKALAATHELSQSCERCHEVYKPPEL